MPVNWAIGTANLGMTYGVTNNSQITKQDSTKILHKSLLGGIKRVDTSQVYGEAEKLIGDLPFRNKFAITSKIKVTPDQTSIFDQILNSLKILKVDQIENLLLHSPDDILRLQDEPIKKDLEKARNLGLIKTYGLSLYTLEDVKSSLKKFPDIGVIQLPENILDQRLHNSDFLLALSKQGIYFQVRSIFLQGVLLQNFDHLPYFLHPLKPKLLEFEKYCRDNHLTKLNACLSYVTSLPWASEVIFSVNNYDQLDKLLNEIVSLRQINLEDISYFAGKNEQAIDPRNWEIK